MMRTELDNLIKYYIKESEEGRYHNPYTVRDLLEMIWNRCEFINEEDNSEWEDKIHDAHIGFWDM